MCATRSVSGVPVGTSRTERVAGPPRQGDQHGAGLGRVADRTEPARSVPGDQRDVGQRFDVVDQCGASTHAG